MGLCDVIAVTTVVIVTFVRKRGLDAKWKGKLVDNGSYFENFKSTNIAIIGKGAPQP